MRVTLAMLVLVVIDATSVAAPTNAQAAFEKGLALMEAKNYTGACAAFELSQRIDPQFGTQYNLAGCYVKLRKIASAWKLYSELARSDSHPQRRAKSGELAASLAPRVPRLRIIASAIDGLEIQVGTTDVTSRVGTAVPFDLGKYIVVARAPGHVEFRKNVTIINEGKIQTIEVVLEREQVVDRSEPTLPAPSRRAFYGKIAMAGGGGFVVGGLIAGARAWSLRNDSRDLCNATTCPDREGSEATADRAQVWGNVATVTVLVGVAAVASGVYLWRTAPSSTAVGAAVSPASASIVVSGRF